MRALPSIERFVGKPAREARRMFSMPADFGVTCLKRRTRLARELDVIEAAKIDGAGSWRIYRSIVLPLIRPILVAVIVFQTLGTWNDFVWPNVLLSSSERRTIILQVYNAVGQFTTNWPLFMAITVVALLPVFIFFVLCQRWIVAGLVAGSVKG